MKYNFLYISMITLAIIAGCGGGEGGDSSNTIIEPDELNPSGDNTRPVANPLTLTVDSASPNIEVVLFANDADGDTLQYELLAATSGTGYTMAYIDSSEPVLYVTLAANFTGNINLPYRVTDGYLFSRTADVTLQVGNNVANTDFSTGLIFDNPKDYASLPTAQFGSDLFGSPYNAPTLPKSIDLSSNFPTPGNQGQQSSCVGWATGYALKSYQERLEIGWSLDTKEHVFSPAFIYNQINGGKDNGSRITEALELIRDKGAATLATMPYDVGNYTTQPSYEAIQEANNYKALEFQRLNDTLSIKSALANRTPVIAGINLYNSVYSVKEVYNAANGGYAGGHAVTITGYDDDKYGGAFKIINSWGQGWGDNGYFWLPYQFANSLHPTPNGNSKILLVTYILKDADNINVNPTPTPTPSNNLPNLQVQDWEASYDPRPGGGGNLQYDVINTGTGSVSEGFNVTLMLSKDTNINSNDIYIVYEHISAALIDSNLATGDSVYRDQDNTIGFRFPEYLQAGIYYMGVWVDDLNMIAESNENDNFSFGESKVTIANDLPDLRVESWYAEWDDYSGNGTLEYIVANEGASYSDSGWWVGLLLSKNESVGNNNLLFAEQIDFQLSPDYTVSNEVSFNLFTDVYGEEIAAGTYDMYVWADYADDIQESSESNNYSFSNEPIRLDYYSGNMNIQSNSTSKAYNGKPLPKNIDSIKIQIVDMPDGTRNIQFLGDAAIEKPVFDKQIRSANQVVFPASKRIPVTGSKRLR